MLTLKDVRQYISGLQITADDRVHIGKLDNKKEKSIGVYPRKGSGPVSYTHLDVYKRQGWYI